MDHLKEINDCFGHAAGDYAIQTAANYLRHCLPCNSILARIGGDEFAAFVLSDDTEFQENTMQIIKEHANAFNSAIVTSGAFKKGIMVESSINDIGITAADGKIGITASADTHVTEYKVTLSVGIGYENGNGGLLVDYIVTADSAGSFEAPFVVKGISAAEYDETASTKFADLSGKQTGTNGLVYAIVGDTIVVDLSSGNSSANRVGSQTSYYLYAFNAEGQTIGSVTYINCNGLK